MSKIVVHRGVVYTSGQTDTSGSTVEEQTLACLAKVDDLLAQAGTDKSRTCARAPPLRAAAAAATRAQTNILPLVPVPPRLKASFSVRAAVQARSKRPSG